MNIQIVSKPISKSALKEIANNQFIDLVKAVVDIEKEIMAIGGELHSDEEALLLEQGSQQKDLWGINLYPDKTENEFIEFDSLINLRPSQGNKSRGVDDPGIKKSVIKVVHNLVR